MKTYVIHETIYREFLIIAGSKDEAFKRIAYENTEPTDEWRDETLRLVDVRDAVPDTADE